MATGIGPDTGFGPAQVALYEMGAARFE